MPRNTVRFLLYAVGLVVLVTVLTIGLVPDIEVEFTETQAREKLVERLPHQVETLRTEVNVEEMTVDFRGSDGVAMDAYFTVKGWGLSAQGAANTVTRVRYEDGAFYLTDVRLDDIALDPDATTRGVLNALRKSATKFLDRHEAQQTTDEARRKFRQMRTEFGPKFHDAVDQFLTTTPVYRLEGGPAQWAALLALKDIKFTHSSAIAILSPAQAILTIAVFLLTVLVLCLLAITYYGPRMRS